ncbi:hypothetical protein C1645_819912 [Glomus cerebriforme]|uniref:Uncharacterized protein n=1 Tax=Glomus cerebriforme TaxID=658196 RepID=A0A397T9M7_9GLOM|nr:hypothetical protein C1645_819912 [Glomus cerebriforme]
MSLSNLKKLAYNILKNLEDASVRDIEVPELGPCLECENEILALPLMPFTTLSSVETGGMSTRRDSESSQSSGTSAISNMFDDSLTLNLPTIGQDMDVDKDEEEVVTQPDTSSKKRANESASVNKLRKRAKTPVKDEDSRILKRLIQELSTDVPQISEAEKQNEDARHELIIAYYYFGEELEKRLIQYNHLEEHEAQKKVNNEVKD